MSQDFWPPVFFMIWTHLAPDKQAKVFSNSVSILLRYSITKMISTVCNIPQRSSSRCATYSGDYLHGVHHTAEMTTVHTTETISSMCNIPRRYIAHCRIKIVIFTCLWLLLKRQQGEIEILLGVNTSTVSWRKRFEEIFFICQEFFFITTMCCTPWRQLCDLISRRNRNWIRKYFSLFISGPDGFKSWKKLEAENLVTHSLRAQKY